MIIGYFLFLTSASHPSSTVVPSALHFNSSVPIIWYSQDLQIEFNVVTSRWPFPSNRETKPMTPFTCIVFYITMWDSDYHTCVLLCAIHFVSNIFLHACGSLCPRHISPESNTVILNLESWMGTELDWEWAHVSCCKMLGAFFFFFCYKELISEECQSIMTTLLKN